VKFFDAEVIEKRELRVDEVGDIEVREGRSKGLPGFRIDAGGAGRPIATAEIVCANDEEAIGVDCFAGANYFVPPAVVKLISPEVATLWWFGMVSGDVVGAGKGVEDEDGIGSVLVERSPGGIGKLRRGNASAFPESEVSEGDK
jgi:hypothetical protein